MRLYDTAQRAVVPFEVGETVDIYTCGITPYDAAHMGHAATYLYYDVLQRRLRDSRHITRCVRNTTDIDDPLFDKARQLGVHWMDLAAGELARFNACMEALGLLPSFSEPRATSAIADVLSLTDRLIEAGHAYPADGSVFFSIDTWDAYGDLSKYDREAMLSAASHRGGDIENPVKKNPLDFVLWQPSAEDEPAWDSQWGRGRPGWHIECSALAMRELGETIDLHGGGGDLIFPHHECEVAQTEAVTGKPFARYWMHVGMVSLDGVKMSKSLGNLVFVHDLLKEWEPPAIRLGVLEHHYRPGFDWTEATMERNARRLVQWRTAGEGDAALEDVRMALDDDLDTPTAVAAIDAAASAGHGVSKAAALLGVW